MGKVGGGLLLSLEMVVRILQRHREAAPFNLRPIFTPEPSYIWMPLCITSPIALQFQDNRTDHLNSLRVDVTCVL